MNDNDPAQIYVARSHANSKLYTVKTFRRNIVSEPALLNQVRSEQACLRTVTEGNALFLPTLLRSFYNEDWLFIITVRKPSAPCSTSFTFSRITIRAEIFKIFLLEESHIYCHRSTVNFTLAKLCVVNYICVTFST